MSTAVAVAGRAGRGEEDACGAGQGQDHAGDCAKAFMGAAVKRYAGGDERVDGDQDKADAIDAGPRGKLIYERIVYLRVTQLVPGNRGDAGGSELKAGPEERGGGQRQAGAAGGPAQQCHGQGRRVRSRGPRTRLKPTSSSVGARGGISPYCIMVSRIQ